MRNKRKHTQRVVVLILAVAGLITCTAPFFASSGVANAQANAPSWSYTGSLNPPRSGYTATLLSNGKVLISGGRNADDVLASAALYDPSSGTWSPTGNLNVPRIGHSATLLQNGKVLVAGGSSNSGTTPTAEIYDPATGGWSLTGNLNHADIGHTAKLLSNGKVLAFSATHAELYDPLSGTWGVTGRLNTPRYLYNATLLRDGKVLVVGGCVNDEDGCEFEEFLGSAELYDPNSGAWSYTGDLNTPRCVSAITTLPNGNVLVAGGQGRDFPFTLNTAELYNPATGRWSYTGSLLSRRIGHIVTLLPNGHVLVAAGGLNNVEPSNSAELYDPATGTWHATASLNAARFWPTASLLLNGKVLVFGGWGGTNNGPVQSAELYDSGSSTIRTNGKIAFRSDRDGNREIYVMNPDGSNQVRLTSNSVVDDCPVWSPDGRKIAFVSQKQNGSYAIFMMNADGTDRTEITALNDSHWATWRALSWSPDGGRIAFHDASAISGSIDIFVVNVDGSGRHDLTADHAHWDLTPTWSPDGSKILFSRYDLYPASYGGTMLHTINVDGTNLTPLVNGFADGWNEDFPDWSPAINKIVYSVNRWDFVFDLYIANPDGTGRKFFHGCDWTDTSCRLDAFTPAFSPDGTKIAFSMYDFVNNIPQKLYVKNLDGTGLTLLTNNGASPSWQPLLPTACPNPIDCNEFFVRQHYLDFLGREPDPLGAQWVNLISNCSPGDTSCDRVHVSEAFFKSPEFQERGYFLYRFYSVSFGRKPDFAEFMPDLARVSGFLSPAELEAAKVTFINDFMARSAFVNRYNALNNTQYVDTLLSTAGVTLSNRQALIDALNAGTKTRAQVLREMVESAEAFNKYFNQAFVVMEYFGYLRRDPDALYLNWIQVLDANPSDSRQMVSGFVNSIEYRQRFGP